MTTNVYQMLTPIWFLLLFMTYDRVIFPSILK
jgi:hypothetical protein